MANKKLFASQPSAVKNVPATNTVNSAGGSAYQMTDKHALAQLAATGTFGSTFYVSADDQLAKVKELVNKVDPEFIAKVAVYARQKGFMKDMPAYLAATLAAKNPALLAKVFERVIDDGKMIRNFVQIIRSGVTGRKSLGSLPKKLINKWINKTKDEALFRASVGNDPSLADVMKLTHPSPDNDRRAALYGYILGKEQASEGKPQVQPIATKSGKKGVIRRYNAEALPEIIKQYENFKKTKTGPVPNVEFRLLTSLDLTREHWVEIAKNAPWHMTRMNLNTFKRHGVFDVPGMTDLIAKKLSDKETISKVKVFPYQLLAAYLNVEADIPVQITNALQDAMEHATLNIPQIDGNVVVCVDVSGSMSSASVTGDRGSVTSKIRAIDVAALVGASILRKNPNARVLPFEGDVVPASRCKLNPRDSVMTNAGILRSVGGGSTNCSAPLTLLNRENAKGDLVVFVSDNESWVDSGRGNYGYGYYGGVHRGTATMVEFQKIKARNPNAKMVCIDLTPNTTMQAIDREDILNIGGFSDSCFEIISEFARAGNNGKHWTDVIESIAL